MRANTTDMIDNFLSAQRVFGARVHAVTAEQWSLPTPDSEWSVADLVSHLVDEHRWAAPLMHGLDIDASAKVVDGARPFTVDGGVGSNLAAAWDVACAESADSFTAADALERAVELSRGPTPAPEYLGEMIFDLVVHSWDLGQAIGFAEGIPEELALAALAQVEGADDLSSSGLFDAPVAVPDDAPTIDRLVALAGRDPQRST